jgi:oxygen-independent coproporphyrinogen-3 oxidase
MAPDVENTHSNIAQALSPGGKMIPDSGFERADKIGLYIHIPFCKQKCFYCDFNSYAGLSWLYPKYVDSLIAEMEKSAGDLRTHEVASIYFGGGTPTMIGNELLEKVLKACFACFGVEDDCEITIEANPETLSLSQLKGLRTAGFNRLSIGFQSLDTRLLPVLGRQHNAQKALQSFDLAKLAGFKSISIDLMYGIPGQDIISWDSTLKNVLRLKPQHISIYALTLDPSTHIAKRIARRELPPVNDDLQAELFNYAREVLAISGYIHYEISNFAKEGFECRHNVLYWRNGDYLGLGAGAHSHFGDSRYSNVRDPKLYIERMGEDESALDTKEQLKRREIIAETIFLGLRLMEGISLDDLSRRLELPIGEVFASTIADLKSKGLLEGEERLRLTSKGILLSNEVFSQFV